MSENNNTQTSNETNTKKPLPHTFLGFLQTPLDAALLVEACVANELQPVNAVPMDTVLSTVVIQSGTVLVFSESSLCSQMIRWRDGRRWSPSRPQGLFLLYREVESSKQNTHVEYTTEVTSRFINLSIRGACRFIPNGLAKRTIGVDGSDGNRYRVVSYFYPKDVEALFEDSQDLSDYQFANGIANLQVPSKIEKFQRFAHYAQVPTFRRHRKKRNAKNSSSTDSSADADDEKVSAEDEDDDDDDDEYGATNTANAARQERTAD
ncbi:hypothetical protein HK100_003821 [Physocladia obscura]|uniref:Uncharacterized protein n=1 Tax=Physocladia obscura TaxID=109957 RepID=A0AAD5XEB9_9FUNG|nr:hypothetical protein HK100_003821 [Physocladia obscura]